MVNEEETNSDKKMEEMLSTMGGYMSNKLKQRIESIKKRLEDVRKSDKKNKEEIEKKLVELIKVMTEVVEKTELQTNTQKRLLVLMENMSKLDTEIDSLLLKDGS